AHLVARLLLEGREHHLAQALGPRAAPAHDDELALVGAGRARVDEGADRRRQDRRPRERDDFPPCREALFAHLMLSCAAGIAIAFDRGLAIALRRSEPTVPDVSRRGSEPGRRRRGPSGAGPARTAWGGTPCACWQS